MAVVGRPIVTEELESSGVTKFCTMEGDSCARRESSRSRRVRANEVRGSLVGKEATVSKFVLTSPEIKRKLGFSSQIF